MITSNELSRAIAEMRGAAPQPPTPQQRAVIEASDEPTLVVAGAGSGKTHTMAQRVLWLVANGKARPDQILGLTFTRKAAAELRGRLRDELSAQGAVAISSPDARGLVPVVQTYNSFASDVFKEWALLIGRDPESDVLTDPAAFLLALRVARASSDARLAQLGSAAIVADRIMQLAGELGDHHATTQAVRRRGYTALFERISGLPDAQEGERLLATGRNALVEDARRVGALDPLLDLVDAFDAEKRRRGAVQFSDQVRFALDAIEAHPDAAAQMRQRFRYVLLDEFQDTSVLQLRLLHRLFAESPVMAVGDPNQAIYGFRGASAGTLQLFAREFSVRETLSLSTSWRNDEAVLTLAHAIAATLPEQQGVPVVPLGPRDGAGPGSVTVRHVPTLVDEARELAEWFRERGAGLGAGVDAGLGIRGQATAGPAGQTPSAAVLVRSHAAGVEIAARLRDEGIAVTRSGGGGLLDSPEVVDIVAALRVLGRPEEGSALVRLLAGSRWGIGVADLAALQRSAAKLATDGLSVAQRGVDFGAVVPEVRASIVDALDAVVDSHALEGASDDGCARLIEAGTLFRQLRTRVGMPLPEFVRTVARALRLDIELAAHPLGSSRAIDALVGESAAFARADSHGTLAGFLDYLDVVETTRGPDAPQPEQADGVVVVMTMHAAKGLEWDLVALPRLAQSKADDTPRGWLDWARLPYPLRGDAQLLPVLRIDGHQSKASYSDARAAFVDGLRDHNSAEADRLSYVAVTRARRELWLSAAQWYPGASRPAKPRPLIQLAADHAGTQMLEHPPKTEGNPLGDGVASIEWPVDPLGSRRLAVERAADLVRSSNPAVKTRWDDTIALLLAESGADALRVPRRIAASGFKDWAADPIRAARLVARPMPERPFAATRLGTLFHSWVEQRGSAATLGDAIDDRLLDDELVEVDEARLERLKATFLASPYGGRTPAEVEIEIHLPLAGTTVVCKLDAVYRDGERATVVDWKTGALPSGADDLEARALQLGLYREAYAAYSGLDRSLVDAELYFVEHDRIIRPRRIETLEELESRLRAAQNAIIRVGGSDRD